MLVPNDPSVRDWLAYSTVYMTRLSFDKLTGYAPGKKLTIDAWLMRIIFLETVAGVPGRASMFAPSVPVHPYTFATSTSFVS